MSNAMKATQHRQALRVGLSLSVAAHVLAIGLISVPGQDEAVSTSSENRADDTPFEAVRIVRVEEPAPEPAPSPAAAASAGAPAPAPSVAPAGAQGAGMPTTLDALLADLAPASPTVVSADASRPIVTARRLRPVATSGRMAEVASALGMEGEEEGGGGWSELLGSIGLVLSGGGHCPMPTGVGPMILR